jgi:hypothetical protein
MSDRADQPSLDAAAEEARRLAGEAYYAGCRMRRRAKKVELWLANAPHRLVEQLEGRQPRIYVIHNDAPRSEVAVLELKDALRAELSTLKADGIRVVGFGPTHDGHLHIRVMGDVRTAQARFDSMYGSNVARVEYGEPVQPQPLRGP